MGTLVSLKASLSFATKAHKILKFKTAIDLESPYEYLSSFEKSFTSSHCDTGGRTSVHRSGSHLHTMMAVREDDAVLLFASQNTCSAL